VRQRDDLLNAFGTGGATPEVFLIALATLSLLSDLAEMRPIALIVDDAQWLDAPSREVLRFVARRLDGDPVAVVVAGRPGREGPAALPDETAIELRPLDREESSRLLDRRAPELDRRSRRRALDLAAGNPLALIELPRLLDRQVIDPANDAVPLTKRLERAFAVRLLDQPSQTRWFLLALAHEDQPSLHEVRAAASRLIGRPADLADVEPAEAAGLVVLSEDSVHFRHPLMRSAARQAATASQREAAHAAWADLLDDQPHRQIWHRAAFASAPDESVAAELEATAARMIQAHEPSSAVAALRRAASLSPHPADRGRRLVLAAEVALQLGNEEEVTALLEAADELPLALATRHTMLWMREALAEASGASSAESLVGVARQLAACGEQRLALEALLTAAVRCHMFRTNPTVTAAVIATADSFGLPPESPQLVAILGLAEPFGQADRVLADLRGVTPESVIRASPDDETSVDALHLYSLALTTIAEFRQGIIFQDAAIAALRAQGMLAPLARALGSHCAGRLAIGDWRLASQAADECLRLSDYVPGKPSSASDGGRVLNAGWSLLTLGTVAANRGQSDLGEQLVDEAVSVMGSTGSAFCLAGIQAARASLALAAGRPADAFQHTARIFDPHDVAFHSVCRWGSVARDLADSALASGSEARARALFEAHSTTSTSPEALGTRSYVEALLAEDDAETHFRNAFELAPPSAYFQGRLELAFGRWLHRERREIEARSHLQSALDAFEAVGAVPWGEQARRELRASGGASRPRSTDQHDELTPQEMQIAKLASAGLSNREIGERLFLSHRTVGSHLYRSFPKLGVRSRAELARALARVPD
jgi:DNA-binding CsgD family transcriptional regulator